MPILEIVNIAASISSFIGFRGTDVLLLPAVNALGRAIRQRSCRRLRAIYFSPNRCDELAALLVREWLAILPGHFDYDT